MATSNNRDVRLGVAIDVAGEADVTRLAAAVRALGKEGDPAAAEYHRLGDALDALTVKTREAREAEAGARTELNADRAALAAKRDELSKLKASSDAATRGTTEFRDAEKTLRLALIDGAAALREKKDGLAQASTAARTAAAAEATLRAELAALVTANKQAGASAKAAGADQVAAGEAARKSLAGIGDQLRTLQQAAAAVVGGTLLSGLIGSLAQTTDQFTNLQARIRLATGEGVAFDTAFKGVLDVAQRTNTSLQATGELFTRIATAGKAIGVTTADALRLTETINQSLIVSGASAESSSAAVTQLIQGLQSGVLRGEEFNSVMEQAPRLAKALSDGLGVTTGELRKLAEAGQLTSAAVIQSLLGQSAALKAEFDKMPLTIGRSIQSLSNAWTQYIGEASNATGASATVAKAIDLVAKNLDTLAALLYGAGKAAIAFKAIRVAEEFLALGTAAKIATAETVAFTAAQTAANAAAGGTAATVSRFASLLGTLKLGVLVTVLANVKEIGTAIGEGTAKLFGYGKAFEQLEIAMKADADAARANAAAKAELAQKMQLAADKALGLNDQSRKLVGEFTDVTLKGGEVSAALEKITKNLELGNLDGIRNAGTALDALAQRALISGAQIRDSLATALKGIDLGVFEAEARAAFDTSEQGARRLKAALDAIALESLRRAGTSVQELQTGFSAAATSALNDLDALAKGLKTLGAQSDDTGRLLAAGVDKALAAANTERAVREVIARLEALGKQGLITGEQLAAGLARAQEKIDDLKPGINSLSEAMKAFGLTTREESAAMAAKLGEAYQRISNSAQVSLADQRTAFEKWAAVATAANGGVETSAVKLARGILEIREASNSAGKAGADAATAIKRGMDAAAVSVGNLATVLDGMAAKARNARFDAEAAAAAARSAGERQALGELATETFNSPAAVLARKKSDGTLSAKDADAAKTNFDIARSNLFQAQQNGNGVNVSDFNRAYNEAREIYEATHPVGLVADPRIAIDAEIVRLNALHGTNPSGSPSGSSPFGPRVPAPAPATASPNSTHVVNLNFGGNSTRVSVSTEADATALVRALEQAARSSGLSA